MTGSRLSLALGEYDTGWHNPQASIQSAARLVRAAAAVGAGVAVLPEMATTGFTMDTTKAVPIDAPDVAALRRLAQENGICLIAGVALREADASCAVNAALAIDPAGAIVAVHRKQRLFTYGHEDQHYAPGTTSTTLTIAGVRVALLICYDLRFPELFAPVAAKVDAIVLIANWPKVRQHHWETLLCARAIENQCYVIGVNRTGVANGLAYNGGSAAFDPWGERVQSGSANDVRIVTLDTDRVATVREQYPFLKDRRLGRLESLEFTESLLATTKSSSRQPQTSL